MRYFITLSYDGSGFFGWQMQPDAISVQQVLQEALSTLLRTDISVTGAGRTDTGVNATGYIAHFETDKPFNADEIGYKLNAILPNPVVVHSISEVAPDLHARFSATNREYTYFLNRVKDPFVEKFSYRCLYPLDIELMNAAAASLKGTHDFSCFEKAGTDSKTSICTVKEAFWAPYTPTHIALGNFPSGGSDSYLYFRISADRFLRNMVRAVVGTLIEVGRGKRSTDDFRSLVLKAGTVRGGNRCAAGESVPGHALFLSRIDY